MTVAEPFDEMVESADTTGGDDRNPHRIRHRAGQRDVKAGFGAVAVHRGEENLAGAVIDEPAGPFDGIEPGRPSPAMGEDAPFSRIDRLCIDRRDDALAAEFLRRLADEIG